MVLLCHFPIFAQNNDTDNTSSSNPDTIQIQGNSLNIHRDTVNTVNVNSGSSAIGKNNTVNAFYSGAFGMRNTIPSNYERIFVYGSDNTVSSSGSFVVGRHVSVSGTLPAFVIGEGLSANYPLAVTGNDGLMVGFQSTKPTLTVTKSNNSLNTAYQDRTGKVGIGDVTPTAKLHIKSDNGEDAGIILEPKQPASKNTFIQMRDSYHKISVSNAGVMQVTAGNHNLNLSGNNFAVSGSRMDVGTTDNLRLVLAAQDTSGIYCNANPAHGYCSRYTTGPSYALRFCNDGFYLRTAEYQQPRNEITNWQDPLYVGIDGKITLHGKVGINTENTTTDYALAVDGGIIATKVYVQSVDNWPDYVFDPGYGRMPLHELATYLETHRHLPDVPSAEEMRERGGVDLVQTQTMLLRKIEEMTLYVIELEKRIAELESRASGDTLRFTYDACGNRTGRTLEFSRMDEHDGGKGEEDPDQPEEWLAELNDSFLGSDVALFPNPTEGRFTLAFPDGIPTGAKATLLTLTGTSLSERAVNGTSEEFDLSAQPAGVYLLRLATDKETRTWKVIKRN